MKFWQWFWFSSLLISAFSFAAITVIVAVKGLRDLVEMFRRIQERLKAQSKL